MQIIDFHNHTDFSPDCRTPLATHIEAAITQGVKHLAITDHMDFNLADRSRDWAIDFARYLPAIRDAQDKYRDRIRIYLGMELGMQPTALSLMREVVKKAEFDFIIGSLHSVQEYDIYYDDFYRGKTPEQAIDAYFDDFIECVRNFKDYCVLGHLDLFYRYKDPLKKVPVSAYRSKLDILLRQVIADGKGIEINTAGKRSYGLSWFNPRWEIVERFYELGGRIVTIGSDSHQATAVGSGFEEVLTELYRIGFRELCTFERMNPVFHRIEV
ncbi:MAG: histidinol-phosphatase HisJ family protein [Bacillota bacterium]|nr:histidinol-phosphatase HisJ family protein [Bacillota bacterium]